MTIDTDKPISVANLAEKASTTSVDLLRDRLRPADAITAIREIEGILLDEWRGLTRNQIDALKLRTDIQFRKLSKVLPDLKAMDHNVGDTASKVTFVLNLGETQATQRI